jgi:hypothetical protein
MVGMLTRGVIRMTTDGQIAVTQLLRRSRKQVRIQIAVVYTAVYTDHS